MGTVMRFEDLDAWKKAREFANQIYRITSSGAFSKDYGFRDQIRRCAVSVMSNIAEGFERGGNKEFLNFLSIAKKSSGELKSQLYLAGDIGYIKGAVFKRCFGLAEDSSRLIAGFIRYLKQSPHKGPKFK